ncbi:hypothetical protein [Neptunomonas phycophila]|uniref:hypothetical protein n=1 Tax=Neptunomonas phycophila TaxID=1572645 RepID=UPI001BEA2A9F|nr:hypothetical protein [Neptunomonas phycophila]MBT3144238.1 hypothetical protein [Neptunomonas phycophila]
MMDHKETSNNEVDSTPLTHSKNVNRGRRKLFGAGLAAPVIFTMSSRTAWGGALCAPSAFNSATFASHHPSESVACQEAAGRSATYWRDNAMLWPAEYLADYETSLASSAEEDDIILECSASVSTWGEDNGYYVDEDTDLVFCRSPASFNQIFNVSIFDDKVTLLEVLRNKTGVNSPLGNDIEASAVAALLNAADGQITLGEPTTNYAVDKVLAIFTALLNGNGYTMSTGQVVYWANDPNGVGFTLYDYFDGSYV